MMSNMHATATQIATANCCCGAAVVLLLGDQPQTAVVLGCGPDRLTVKPTPKVTFLPSFCFTLKSARPDGLCANFHPASSLETRVTEALGVALLAGMMMDQLIGQLS